MIDLILFVFVVCVFAAGFWCGNEFRTVSNMVAVCKKKLVGLFS